MMATIEPNVAAHVPSAMKKDGRSHDRKTKEAIRIMTVKRILEGEDVASVMASYGLCRTTGYKWLAKVTERGRGTRCLAARKGTGRKPKLTRAQKSQVFRWVNGKSPMRYGFSFALWTRDAVRELILQKLGISLSVSSVGSLLAELHLTPQKPLLHAYQRNPQAIKRWLRETFPAISRRSKAEGGEVYFWNESGFCTNPTNGKTLVEQETITELSQPEKQQSINTAWAVNTKGAFWFSTHEGQLTNELFSDLLKRLTHRREKPLHLVVDGLPAHQKPRLKEYAVNTKVQLTLHFLPG